MVQEVVSEREVKWKRNINKNWIKLIVILTFGIPMLMIYLVINGGLWLIGKENKLDEWWSKFKTYVS